MTDKEEIRRAVLAERERLRRVRSRQVPHDWIGGNNYTRPRQQFQILFMRYGFEKAMQLAPDLILWPDHRRPPRAIYHRWATDADEGDAVIPEKIERAFLKRIDGQVKSAAESVVLANAQAAVTYADKARNGDLVESDAKILVALNNGTGFVFREIIGSKKEPARPDAPTNFFINAGPPVQRALRKGTKAPVYEAEFKDVTVGSGDP